MSARELPRPAQGSRGTSTMAPPATIPPPPPSSAGAWRFPLPPSPPPSAASPAGKALAFLVLAIALAGFGFALSTPAISVAGVGALALGVLVSHTLPVGVWFEKVSGWVAATVVVVVYLVVAGVYGAVTRTVPPLQPAPFLGLAVVGMDFQRADRLRPAVFLSVLALLPLIGTKTEVALVLAMIWLGAALCALWILQGDTDRGQRRAQPVRTPDSTTGEELPLSGSELLRILGSAALISLALVLVIGNPSCSSTGSRISVIPADSGHYSGGGGGLDPDTPFVDPGDIGGGIPGGGIPGGGIPGGGIPGGDVRGGTGDAGGSTGEAGGTGGDVGGARSDGDTATGGRSGNGRSDNDSGGGPGDDSPAGGGGRGNGETGSGPERNGPGSGDGSFGDGATPSTSAPTRAGPAPDTDSPGRNDADASSGRGNAGTSGPGGGATRSGGGAGERSSGSGSAAASGPGVPDADTGTDLTPLLLILLCVGVIIAALVVGAMLYNKLGDDDDDDDDELAKPRRRWFGRRRPPTVREWGRATIARLIEEGERRGRHRAKSETIARYCTVLCTEVIAEPRLIGVARVLDDALYGAGAITGEEMTWVDNVLDQIRSLPNVPEPEPEPEADDRPMAAV